MEHTIEENLQEIIELAKMSEQDAAFRLEAWAEVTQPEPVLTDAEKILQDAEMRLKRLTTNLTRLELKTERTKAAKAELEKFVRSSKKMLEVTKELEGK